MVSVRRGGGVVERYFPDDCGRIAVADAATPTRKIALGVEVDACTGDTDTYGAKIIEGFAVDPIACAGWNGDDSRASSIADPVGVGW